MIKNKRNSTLEMLRIVSMLFIVANHYSGETPWKINDLTSPIKILGYYVYKPLGQVGVDIFVLITGYFMITREDVVSKNIKRVGKIWLEVLFYSIICFLTATYFSRGLSIKRLIVALFPFSFSEYWFVTAYIMLIILIPLINLSIKHITKNTYIYILVSIILFSQVFPIINNNIFSLSKGFGDVLTVYLLGGFLRKYPVKLNRLILIMGISISYLLMLCSILVLSILTKNSGNLFRFCYGFLPFVTAVNIFILFINLSSTSNEIVNKIAESVFSTYIITENPNINEILWHHFFNMSSISNIILVIFLGAIISLVLLVLTVILDKLRIWLFTALKINIIIFNIIDRTTNKFKLLKITKN